MVIVARGMRIALIAQDGFSKLLATGLTFGLALQTFIIVGGVLRVVPLTGITLPFVSYGGSSIVSNFVMLGLLLLVSNRAAATAVHERMNRQITRVAGGRDGAARRAHRRDDLLADVGPARPRRAAGQRDPAGGAVRDQAGPDPLARHARARPEQGAPASEGRTFYFRRYPQGRLAAHVVGYSTAARSRTGLERSLNPVLTGLGAQPLVARRPVARQAERQADRRRHRRHDARHQRPARGPRRARYARCGAVVALDPRTGRVRVMVSSPSYNPNDVETNFGRIEKIRADCTPASPLLNRATPGPVPAGLDVQGRDRLGRARLAASTRRRRRSSTRATARSTASG